ncbi:MAG: tetratricopeptide repeat-containing serine protease family protein [Verrucomicrobia bacterium]|nr:tetratricopeptide repeat-containing serine protease family protein [Verrucomicrobiota bacterium]
MKANSLACAFLLLISVAVQPLAQETQTNEKFLEETRAEAEKGDRLSQYFLGPVYTLGIGVTNDAVEAASWYRKAADQGYADAQNDLGWLYWQGNGVPKDAVKATEWYRKAAEQGHMEAQSRLAYCFLQGAGVNKDGNQACLWLRKAAEQGDRLAQVMLALILKAGGFPPFQIEVEADASEAAKWYLRAARQGDGDAQICIGQMFAEGDGIRQDFVEAYKWCNIAAGSLEKPDLSTLTPESRTAAKQLLRPVAERAKVERNRFAGRMTLEQIAEAQQLTREFRPRKESASHKSPSIENPTASGTGFFITEDGFLVTNEHVVKDGAQIRLLTSAGLISAKVVKVNAANDLALLKAEGRFAALPVATSRTVRLGGTVATVGFPNIGLQGFAPKLAKGEVASLSGAQDDARYFQISEPVQPGTSGGALVDEHGNVVGVVSAKLSARAALKTSGALPENVNYAVKSSFLLGFLESVPEVPTKLKEPLSAERKFDDVVQTAQQAAVLVLVY